MKKLLNVNILPVLLLALTGGALAGQPSGGSARSVEGVLVPSCELRDVMDVGSPAVPSSTISAICEKMARRIGANPSARSLRELSEAVYMMKVKGGPQDMVENAYQCMRVVESRGQLKNDAAMISTFNIIYKIHVGMEGRVSPRELNMLLSSFGNMAKKINDEGVYYEAAALSVRKQDAGY